MKKLIVLIAFATSFASYTHAQEVKVASIPYPMHFINKNAVFSVMGNNSIKITAPSNSDIYISAGGEYTRHNSSNLLFRPDSTFILTAKITPTFRSKWDAGALLVYNDSTHFAKFCFEKDYQGQARIVTVVTNGISDDCNSMAIDSNSVFYRIVGSTKSNSFTFYYSENGKTWFPIRSFILQKSDKIQIGFSAQSPTGEKCTVDFSEIELQQRKLKDFWLGE